jgi:hypothetical protein
MQPEHPIQVSQRGQGVFESLTSLALGMALVGRDVLSERIEGWVEGSDEEAPDVAVVDSPLGLAAIGLTVEVQRSIVRSVAVANAVGSSLVGASRAIGSLPGFAQMASMSGALKPVTRPAERAWDHLVELGREKEATARALAGTALRSSTDVAFREVTIRAIEEVAQNETARDILREETVGMGEAAVDEVRGLAREADDRLEKIARTLFRRRVRTPLATGEQPV